MSKSLKRRDNMELKKIVFEISSSWAKEQKSSNKHLLGEFGVDLNRMFLGNFISILSLKEIPVYILSSDYPAYGKRAVPKGHLVFSFHTYQTSTNMFSYKEAPIYGMFSIDKNGYSGWADINVNFEKYRSEINRLSITKANEIIKEQHNFFLKTKLSKYEQKKRGD